MNARVFGLLGVIAAVSVGCHSDPTNSLAGTPAKVNFQFTTLKVEVADSFNTFVTLQDQGSTPIAQLITVTSCDPTTVAISGVSNNSPEVVTNFVVRGVKYGTACVVATSNGLSDTMQVATVPDKIVINGGPDTVLSGDSGMYTYQYLDKAGNPMTGVPSPTWSSTTAAFGTFADGSVPTYSGVAPGVNTITASVSLSALGGTVTQKVSVQKTVTTIPGIFSPTFSAAANAPGAAVVAVDPALASWDGDATVSVGGVQAFLKHVSGDSVTFIMPAFGDTKNRQVLFSAIGSANLSLGTSGTDSIRNSTTSLDGPFAPGDEDPSTASVPTLPHVHGDTTVIFDVNHGTCAGGAATDPGDHCDSFFQLNNNTAAPDTVSFQLDWVAPLGIDNPTTGGGGPDQDMLFCNAACSGYVGNFDGASTNTPEKSTVVIPANTVYNLWINLYDPAGQTSVLFRVTMSHK